MKRTLEDKGKAHQDSGGGGSGDDNTMEKTLNRGSWTQQEDDLLIAYVTQHGDGNWNAVAKNSNLSRCSKSCRLRWMNHLRPNLKKGAFSKEEEQRVVELHAAMGNRWAKMTSHLPGRTDNEIKNFWNTRLKRMKRQGLPVYPDKVRERAMNAATQPDLNTGHSLDPRTNQDSLEQVTEELPVPDFKFLPADTISSYYQPISSERFLRQRRYFLQHNMYNSIAPSSGTALPFTSGGSNNEQSLPLENCPFAESALEDFLDHMLDSATWDSPSGTAIPFTDGGPMNEQIPPENFASHEEPGSRRAQKSDPIPQELELNNSLVQAPLTGQTLPNSPSSSFIGMLDSTEYGLHCCELIPGHESDNTLVQPPLTDQTPSNFPSTHGDGLLEPDGYGSSGERQATEAVSESLLDLSSALANFEFPLSLSNTAGTIFDVDVDFPSLSIEDIAMQFDDDWLGFSEDK